MNIQTLQPTSSSTSRQLATTGLPSSASNTAVDAVSALAAVLATPRQEARPAQQQQQHRFATAPSTVQPFLEPGIQQDIAAAQQGQAWLQDMNRKLGGLKQSLAGLLTGPAQQPSSATQALLRQVQQGWSRRAATAGGMVDGQLRIAAPGQARQAFTVRGLDLAALTEEGPETLSFAVPGSAQAVNVSIDPDESAESLVQRLDQGLAPAGVRAALVGGALRFDTDEAQWPALRDGLAVKGDGRRFPSGQRVRVRLEPQADAMQPGQWSLEGPQAQRQTLARVIAAQAQLDKAGAALREQTAALRLPESADAAERGEAMLGFAREFGEKAAEGGYEHIAQLPPALKGMRREQVRALLKAG